MIGRRGFLGALAIAAAFPVDLVRRCLREPTQISRHAHDLWAAARIRMTMQKMEDSFWTDGTEEKPYGIRYWVEKSESNDGCFDSDKS